MIELCLGVYFIKQYIILRQSNQVILPKFSKKSGKNTGGAPVSGSFAESDVCKTSAGMDRKAKADQSFRQARCVTLFPSDSHRSSNPVLMFATSAMSEVSDGAKSPDPATVRSAISR